MKTESDVLNDLVKKALFNLNSLTSNDTSIAELINQIISMALKLSASDIHIEPIGDNIRIRVRIDGMLQELCSPIPGKLLNNITSRIKIISKLDSVDYRNPQDGRFTFTTNGKNIDIRVSSLPLLTGQKTVLRLLTNSQQLLDISALDFSPENEELFRDWCRKPYGLILNVGPVNSGKTTTLYAALTELNSLSRNIVTIEDPVEYQIPGINQIQVNTNTNLSFAAGLRALLRQDPDIIMLGEIRDKETAEIAIRAALTGRLLFTTLHTADAVGAIFRLIDMEVLPYMLSASLIGIMAQRLVRRLCPHCAKKYIVSPDSPEAAFLGNNYAPLPELYEAVGCPQCNGTGYNGRIALHELLPITEKLRQAIINRLDLHSFEGLARQEGMQSLLQDGIQKAIAGKTTLAEIRRVIYGEFH